MQGDLKDVDGRTLTEELEIWYRDPVECVKELMGNPMFRDVLTYTPLRTWLDEAGTEAVIGEMSSAEWWWKLQVCKSLTIAREENSPVYVSHVYLPVPLLLHSFSPRTRLNSQTFAETRARGHYISQSETSPRIYAVCPRHMLQF